MKNLFFAMLLGTMLCGSSPAFSATLNTARMKALGLAGKTFTKKSNGVWSVEGGITVYSTETFAPKVLGFGGPVPLFIAVSAKGKILSIAAAPNNESYFDMIEEANFLHSWDNKTLRQAAQHKPDAVSGATYTSNAITENVTITAKKLTGKAK